MENIDKDIKRIECLIEKCKQCKLNACITCDICWSEVQAIENLLSRLKTVERMNDVLADKVYRHIDMMNMLDVGKEIDYDLEKIFNGLDDEEVIKIIKEWARKNVEDG